MFFKKSAVICLLVLSCFLLPHFAHAHTYRVPVVVDTDMALDDMRALIMLLNSHMVDIPLIVVSDGVSSPEKGAANLNILLSCLDRDHIPVAMGKTSDMPPPMFRPLSENIQWPDDCAPPSQSIATKTAPAAILEALKAQAGPVVYLCLGPMTNLAEAIRRDPEIKSKISRVIYFGDHPQSADPGWNTARDIHAASTVFTSGVDVYCIHPTERNLRPFDRNLLEKIEIIGSPAAQLVSTLHGGTAVQEAIDQQHLMIWDENTVIYLENPELFKVGPVPGHAHLMQLKDFDPEEVSRAYLGCLGYPADDHLDPRHAVVLKMFPHDPAMFKPDVALRVNRIIAKYGVEEWKAAVLTHELHRHLGIYSLVGAKMGVRAREILDAPFDVLKVVSHAGSKPPLSCMNDGLQVSTGASLGRGTIHIDTVNPRPSVTFIYGKERLDLTLKREWQEKIKADIKAAIRQFGGLNKSYFAHIRKLSIAYWQDFDRGEIFYEKLGPAK
ncbi:inosine-uridine preferring nucleoside hydrolase [delta proteobacterium NaphS2]|nr:inosine-uridine preferring nucleoside hydrolase [delta proteobacterium NaphS2]